MIRDLVGSKINMEDETQEKTNMVKVQVGEHNYYLDGYLKSNLEAVQHSVRRNDFDSFIVVTGREGFGKSTVASQVALFLDPTYNLSRCCFTSDQFKEACVGADKFQAIVFDETMGYLSSRGAMSKFNRDLIKVMSEMRSKNLFVILCIPNFFELDRYAAIHRTTGLIHVYKRGRIGCYDYRTKKLLYLKGKKFYSYSCVSPNFIGACVKYFPHDKAEYEKKKQGAIDAWMEGKGKDNLWKTQRDIMIKEIITRGFMTKTNLSELIDISIRQIGTLSSEEAG